MAESNVERLKRIKKEIWPPEGEQHPPQIEDVKWLIAVCEQALLAYDELAVILQREFPD